MKKKLLSGDKKKKSGDHEVEGCEERTEEREVEEKYKSVLPVGLLLGVRYSMLENEVSSLWSSESIRDIHLHRQLLRKCSSHP